MQISREAALELARIERWLPWVYRGIRVLVILTGAWLVSFVSRRLLRRLRAHAVRSMDRHGEINEVELEKRAATVGAVLTTVVRVVIWMIATVMALRALTFDIQPLLAGLGVVGLALGLGAQTLIKDFIGGLLLLMEDQIRIGDSVVINGISGVVEELNLRTAILRSENGAVHVISNGAINTLSNLTREYSYYMFEVTLAHQADIERALHIIEQAGASIEAEEDLAELVLAPIDVMGVERLLDRGLVIRARIKTLPAKQALVGRELNRRVSALLMEAGVPFPPTAA
jgi:moderate conductance mechanosensitive channel